MKKKDWKKKLRELSFMKGYYFKLEDNGLVEKKDDQLVFNREELECFVQQELDKAREEGRKEGMVGMLELAEKHSFPLSVVLNNKEIARKLKELSKLKTKE